MKSKLLALIFLAGTVAMAQPRWGVSVGFGYAGPARVSVYSAPPAPVYAYAPPAPGPGYSWVAGYYQPVGPRWAWRAGYWARPPYARARWIAPRYNHGYYYHGYWRR
jgi:hypothetical protein